MNNFYNVLNKTEFCKNDIIEMLSATNDKQTALFKKAKAVKEYEVGKKVYFRGLIEFSNICQKNCLYCGIRSDNKNIERFNIDDNTILKAAGFAYKNNYGSIVLQSGELQTPAFINRIEKLIKEIKKISNNNLGITLSLGEQTIDTYKKWFNAGAHRYLLRIESSNEDLYNKIHPNNNLHSYNTRLNCLKYLQKTGYQTGTGVMIGLPHQTIENLADDIIFMRDMNIDMVGMGPYIEHNDTPLAQVKNNILPLTDRFYLALRMIATLRIVMPNINIAASTALQAIDPIGREKAVNVGANIIMPNITPALYRNQYKLYNNKPCITEEPEQCVQCLDARLQMADSLIGYGEWGDSKRFFITNKTDKTHNN